MTSLSQFVTNDIGKAVTYDNIPENYGQCEQLDQLYCIQCLGWTPPLIAYAALWWTNPVILEHFDQITPGNEQAGDLGIFGPGADINSPVEGHMDIVYLPKTGSGFMGFDSNWEPNVYYEVINGVQYPAAHLVNHTYEQLNNFGFLRFKGTTMPNAGDITNVFEAINFRAATPEEVAAYDNLSISDPNGLLYNKILPAIASLNQAVTEAQNATYTPVSEQLYTKNS